MPVRDGQAWIHESMMSILTQDHQDFEVLIVDDGSTDNSISIALDLGGEKVRIVKGEGQGLARALALGVGAADTELIARMDQDDIANPARLTRQINFLSHYPDHVLIGSNVTLLDDLGRRVGRSRFPLTDRAIRKRMAIGNAFAHSSVMFRKSSVLAAGNYTSPDANPYPEDYHLWTRLLHVGTVANLNECLVDYRVNDKGVSQVHRNVMRAASARISWNWYTGLYPAVEHEKALESAWFACFGGNSRVSMRQAALVTQALIRLQFPGFSAGGQRGLRLRHYAIPYVKVLRPNSTSPEQG